MVRPLAPAPRVATRPMLSGLESRLADAATDALVREARLAGKPGLVGPGSSAGHDDMTLETMLASTHALRPWFAELARLGGQCLEPRVTRRHAGLLGRRAEQHMLAATGGVNTHRGAVWALGLLTVSAGRLAVSHDGPDRPTPHEVTGEAAAIAALPDPAGEAARHGLAGASARDRHGVGGAVGEATSGFPHALLVLDHLRSGASELTSLVACMASLDDTCLLHRGGARGLADVQREAARVLALGPDTAAGRRALRQLDRTLTLRRLSPGGSADMLAAALFLDRLCPTVHRSSEQGEPCRS